uniref:Zinc transporter 2 n=1 Tax=Syphacia muris TaxID=451379 RepID=A0A0N5AI03_9BILA
QNAKTADHLRSSNYGSTEAPINEFHCHAGRSENTESNSRAKRILWISLAVCLGFMICEVVGGWIAHSLAIMTDAAHLLTDFASMLVSLFSLYLANRPASQRMSFGWHRAEVLGAFLSVFLIWVVTGILVYMAVNRILQKTYNVDATVMAITAGLGVLVNLAMALLLYFDGHQHTHGSRRYSFHPNNTTTDRNLSDSNSNRAGKTEERNINVRAAMVHVIGDLVESVGVLVAAVLIFLNKNLSVADPICTMIFSIIVLYTTVYVIRDAIVVLLEGRPSNIDFRAVFDSLEKIEGVVKVHDLRIWSLTLDKVAISVHLEIRKTSNAQRILRETTLMLRENYGVHESTVQIEGHLEDMDPCNFCIPPQ